MPFILHSKLQQRSARAGFTLVEVLIVAPIILLTIAVFVGIIINLTGETLSARAQNKLAFDVQNALNYIEQDIKLSGGFLATNNFGLVASQGDGYNSAQKFLNVKPISGNINIQAALILDMPVISQSSSSDERSLVFLKNQPNACTSPEVSQNKIMNSNVVYFVSEGSLWRRTIMPSDYLTAGCSQPEQLPTCARNITIGASSFCKAHDMRLVDGVADDGFFVQYFSSVAASLVEGNDLGDAVSISKNDQQRQVVLDSSQHARVAIAAKQIVAGREISFSSDVLLASRVWSF